MSSESSTFEISESSNWGRFITAKRDYGIGELILDEAPLLIGLLGIEGFHCGKIEGDVVVSSETCIGCFKLLNEVTKSCIDCTFPVCCEQCSLEPFHKRYDCKLFKDNQILPNNPTALLRLSTIRAILMYKNNEKSSDWQSFTTLSSELECQTEHFKEVVDNEIINATKWINDVCKLEVDEATVGKIYRTFFVNGFSCNGNDENGSSYQMKLLYKTAALFSHSCSPNSDWIILPTNQNGIKRWHIRIYAVKNIACNEPITIAYLQDFMTGDTATRQKTLLKEYHFHCRCDRCLDVSEFGFYTSAMKCRSCKDPHLLPDDPSDPNSPWTCDFCRSCTDALVVKNSVDEYEKLLSYFVKTKSSGELESCLENMMNSLDERNLTMNHRVVTITMFYWITVQKVTDLLEHTMESQLKFIKTMERATQCLKMFRMFNTLRSVVFVELMFANSIGAFYFKTENLSGIEYDNYSSEEKRIILSAIYSHLKTAVDIMECSPYHPLCNPFLESALQRLKFWQTRYQAVEVVQAVNEEGVAGVDPTKPAKAFPEKEAKNTWEELKPSPCVLSESPSNDSENQSSRMSQSVTKIPSNDFESIACKPDVSLLSQYDFYYNN